jgi:hypothetical protein
MNHEQLEKLVNTFISQEGIKVDELQFAAGTFNFSVMIVYHVEV